MSVNSAIAEMLEPAYDLKHLEMRARQTGDYQANEPLTSSVVQMLLRQRLDQIAMESMKADVRPFLRNPKDIESWGKEFFLEVFEKLKAKPHA